MSTSVLILQRGGTPSRWYPTTHARFARLPVQRPGRDGVAPTRRRRPARGEDVARASPGLVEEPGGHGVAHGVGRSRAISNLNVLAGHMSSAVMTFVMAPALCAMALDPNLSLGGSGVGYILACGNFGGVVGKAASATLVLKLTPKGSMAFVLAGTALGMILFTGGSTTIWFGLCWMVSRFFVAVVWVSLTQLMCQLHPPSRQGASLGNAALVARLGSIFVTMATGHLIANGFSWRMILMGAATVGLIGASLVVHCVTIPPQSNDNGRQTRKWSPSSPSEHTSPNSFLGYLREYGEVRRMLLNRCLLQAVIELQMFIALFGQSFQGLSTPRAAQHLVCYNSGAAISLFLSSQLYCILSKKNCRLFVVACCFLSTATLYLLSTVSSPFHASVLFFILGATVAPSFYISIPEFNVQFAGGKSAILEGGSEMLTFVVALLVDCVVGCWIAYAGPAGWPLVFKVMALVMLYGALSLNTFLSIELKSTEAQTEVAKKHN